MSRGTVVLTLSPFTDLSGANVRPAIIISRSDRAGDDVILAFISSVLVPRPLPTDLPLDPSHPDFRETGLKISSIVKCDKLAQSSAGSSWASWASFLQPTFGNWTSA